MRSYTFQVQLERDAEGWRAFYLPWESEGASTWGKTQEEALQHIQEVLAMIISERAEEGRLLDGEQRLSVSEGPAVTVTV